jgi:AcrR family transcriptional regulator
LVAGLEVFSARGFDGATTRAIAEKAGVALASLPYHFKTKEALWKAVANDIFERFALHMAKARARLGDAEPRERTRALLSEYMRFTAQNPQLLQIAFQEGVSQNSRTEWLVENHLRPNFEYVKSETLLAVKNGYGRSGRLEHLYYMIVGAAALPYVVGSEFQALTNQDPTDPELIEAHIQAVLDLFYPSATQAQDPSATQAQDPSATQAQDPSATQAQDDSPSTSESSESES